MGKDSCWVLLFILLLSFFVAKIHGRRQAQTLGCLRKSMLKGVDSSLFKAEEVLYNFEAYPEEGLKEKDRIKRLPGQPQVKFSQYGGYVTVNKLAGRAFYYYFVEAQRSKDTLPLLLWLNGGPGCSSLGFGAMEELGPFRVHSDGKTLYTNRYSWNYAANVLFLETPAGTGFSYSNRTSDYNTWGDRRTATDNYVFLVNWLERFPEYKKRELYIAGESYAGHYVPQLAHTILYHNKKANKTTINLKGIMIGNAVIDHVADGWGLYDFYAGHALISDRTTNDLNKHCDFTKDYMNQSSECNAAKDEADNNIDWFDEYNIYAPLCNNTSVTAQPKKGSIIEFDPCSDNYVHAYLNREDVQDALHANVTKLTHDWQPCSDVINKWGDRPTTIIPLLKEFITNGLRVWIFSGDIDAVVPFTSTRKSINKMNLPVKTAWHPWLSNGEVGGYTEIYKGDITFATVRGAGHEVPSYQPARAFSLVKHFLDGTPLPNTKRL